VIVGGVVVGELVSVLGAVFALQGLGYIPGSVMTGDMHWFWIGGAMFVVGQALFGYSFLRLRKARQTPDR
jgi:hypothetical protein